MSGAARVVVTLDHAGRIKDIAVGGHSIAGAVTDASLNAGPAHRFTDTTVQVVMTVDEVITEGSE